MKKKEIKKKNKQEFLEQILPSLKLKEDFFYKTYPHFVKIYYKEKIYDYYPGAEKMFDLKKSVWIELERNKLLEMITQ